MVIKGEYLMTLDPKSTNLAKFNKYITSMLCVVKQENSIISFLLARYLSHYNKATFYCVKYDIAIDYQGLHLR